MRPSASDLLGEDSEPLTVDAATLAEVLGCTVRYVNRLAADSIIERDGPGRFDLRRAVRAYLSHRLGDKPGVADKARREKANADLMEAKAAAIRGELVNAEEVAREWAGILRDVRAGMLALPSRIRSRLPHLTQADAFEIDAEIRRALAALGGEK